MSLEDKCDEVVGQGLSASQNAFRIPILIYITYEDDTRPHIYYIYPYIYMRYMRMGILNDFSVLIQVI